MVLPCCRPRFSAAAAVTILCCCICYWQVTPPSHAGSSLFVASLLIASSRRATTFRRPVMTTAASSPSLSWDRTGRQTTPMCLFAGRMSPDGEEEDGETTTGGEREEEETLMAMHLSLRPGVTAEEALERTSLYVRSFPFAAVLPVQPLRCVPTEGGAGVDVTFLRKPTAARGGTDGGIRFSVAQSDGGRGGGIGGIDVVAKRNSEGQAIAKVFSEKIVIQTFVRAMSQGQDGDHDDDDRGKGGRSGTSSSTTTITAPVTRVPPPTKNFASLESIFHKWM